MSQVSENIESKSGHVGSMAAPAGATLPMVLHVRVITGAGGGPDKTILNSPRFLGGFGYQSVCAFLRTPGDRGFQVIRDRAAAWNAKIEEIDDRGALDWRVLPRLLEVCRRLRVKIWHAHDYKTNMIGLLLQRFHPMRLVTTTHGWVEFTPRTRLYYLLDRYTLPRYERVICVSEDILQRCHGYRVPEAKSILIENAIDTEQFRRSASIELAKERLGWSRDRFMIGAAGRLSEEKGFDILLRSIRDLVDRGLDVGLIIAGDGNERDSLNSLVHELQLQQRVRLVGFQSDLRPLYEAMDVFALSSRREGLPNVVLEAMALETPVVSTRVAGVPRLIADGDNGLLVDLNNQAALSAALTTAFEQPQLRGKLAAAGRRTIEERYSFAMRMGKVATVYDEVLKHANGTRNSR